MSDSHLIPLLKELGFNGKEAKIYLTLLELNGALPSTLARITGIKRTTIYGVLEGLRARGLVGSVQRKECCYYLGVAPELLLEAQKNKCKAVESLIPELNNLRTRYGVRPQMSIYEGVDGIIQIMEDTLEVEGEIFCWSAGTEAYEDLIFKNYHSLYSEKKNKLGIMIRGLFQYDDVGLELKRRGVADNREVYLISKDKFPFENEINIYNDKMSIISHKDQVGVIIQNQAIADTQRSIFKFAFEYAKMLEPQILSEEHKKEFGY
ncbi:MAG: sugar-specific transcriptional regulator TrmB [Oceanicoccus sp.]|jgi:sugar-specific transcriptional regulator TrmB